MRKGRRTDLVQRQVLSFLPTQFICNRCGCINSVDARQDNLDGTSPPVDYYYECLCKRISSESLDEIKTKVEKDNSEFLYEGEIFPKEIALHYLGKYEV